MPVPAAALNPRDFEQQWGAGPGIKEKKRKTQLDSGQTCSPGLARAVPTEGGCPAAGGGKQTAGRGWKKKPGFDVVNFCNLRQCWSPKRKRERDEDRRRCVFGHTRFCSGCWGCTISAFSLLVWFLGYQRLVSSTIFFLCVLTLMTNTCYKYRFFSMQFKQYKKYLGQGIFISCQIVSCIQSILYQYFGMDCKDTFSLTLRTMPMPTFCKQR